jgi:murein DD-endopeptidase MepM/ murein hydrolase activator NlpD
MNPRTLGTVAAAFALLATLAVLPAVLTLTAADPTGSCGTTTGGPIDVILATIRQVESGGNYTSTATGSSASGAYGFINQSWAGYGGYPSAYLAPASVQDAKATEYVTALLAGNGGDVSLIGVAWYLGHVPPPGSPEWDVVPAPGAGNRFSPRQYQTKWMDIYRTKLAGPSPSSTTAPTAATTPPRPCEPGQGVALPGGWALPGPKDVLDRTADQINNPHHGYPAWDWSIPVGTPIYAIRGGTVISLTTNPYNCAGQTACNKCGLGVIVEDQEATQWTYCHGSAQHVNIGDTVTAGQQILSSGNTGNSTGPHVHIAIRAVGLDRCPQPLIASLYQHSLGLDPQSLPTNGCTH